MGSQFNRTAIYVSLGLAVALVIGVIVGAKYIFATADRAPVAMSDLPSSQAGSQECTDFVAALPEKFMGHPRATLADPAPAGAAAWATLSDQAVTLRCGVDLPYQYNDYSVLSDIDGENWLEVTDMTPGSDLTTWYTTERFPVIAVTTHGDEQPEGLDLEGLARQEQPRNTAPLSDLAAADASATASCTALDDALPADLADGYAPYGAQVPADTYVWTAPGREAIVLRCGVAPPPGYKAGEQLQQINDVPWFEDTTLASGTTASTWFALGRATDIAVHVPQDVADEVLVGLSDVIASSTPSQ